MFAEVKRHKPSVIYIPGIETFEGHSFHTSRWDYAYTGGAPTEPLKGLRDKRVGILRWHYLLANNNGRAKFQALTRYISTIWIALFPKHPLRRYCWRGRQTTAGVGNKQKQWL